MVDLSYERGMEKKGEKKKRDEKKKKKKKKEGKRRGPASSLEKKRPSNAEPSLLRPWGGGLRRIDYLIVGNDVLRIQSQLRTANCGAIRLGAIHTRLANCLRVKD